MYEIVIGRTKEDREKFGMDGTILLGKHYVKMGRTTSLSNEIYLDIARAHVIYICGKRGAGKCLSGDSLITLDNGELTKIEDIEKDNNRIFSLNHNLKLNQSDKQGFYKRTVSNLTKITLRSGKQLKLTPEHPLLTIEGWAKTNQLKEGSRIATPRSYPSFGSVLMKESEIKLLAYLIAEGHTKKPVLFCNTDNELIKEFTNSVKDFDGSLEVTAQSNNNYRINSRNIKRKQLETIQRNKLGQIKKSNKSNVEKTSIRVFLEKHNLYNKSALEKDIPGAIQKLPKHLLALFLNRLFSCDGTIYRKDNFWKVAYCSSSKDLALKVHHLLLRFGILSKLRHKSNTFEIELNNEHSLNFIKEIGFFGKKQLLQQLALSEETIIRTPNVDTIPKEVWNNYRPESWVKAGQSLKYDSPKSARSSINYAPSRQKLQQIALTDGNQQMLNLADSDIFWDEIIKIEQLTGCFDVYDISVPDTHNFVANDIIVHNSYTMGVIAEGLADMPKEVSQNLSIILLDTMGIYWTMKYPNKKDDDLLAMWGLKGKGLPVQIYTPTDYYKDYKSKGIPTDFPFAINPAELSPQDWAMTFGIDRNDPLAILIERTVNSLKKTKDAFDIQEIIDAIHEDERAESREKDAAENRFLSTLGWGLFDKNGTPLKDLAVGGQITVLDVSCYATMPGGGWAIKSLVVGLIAQKLFVERMLARKNEEFQQIHHTTHYFGEAKASTKLEMPLVWLVIDEAHEFLPNQGKTTATDPLVTILREGRQPGISLILATQQPGKIHTDVMTQSDTLISHRITARIDTEALGTMMQSYMREGLDKFLNELPRVMGAAIILDDTNERMYPMRMRPRFTWHGGESPMAVRPKKKNDEI